MYISTKDWKNFINALSKINEGAANAMVQYIQKYGFADKDALVGYAYNVVNTFGNASASVAASMYDEISELEGKFFDPAELAETPDYGEVAKTVYGTLKQSENANEIGGAVSRLVKRTGQDTLIKNGMRDGAEFAWIPSGDTCSFCLTLASRGWQPISKKALRNGHAEHIHSNCDCSYMVRHSDDVEVSGYDPDKYLAMYEGADGSTPNEKINAMRRMKYAQRKDIINAQKRAAYALRNNSSTSEKSGDLFSLDLQYFAERDIINQESNSLKRAIRKYNKHIEQHYEKINNPEKYISDWNEKSEEGKAGLIKHWNKEIRNWNTSIEDRITELRKRGDYDE